MSWRRAHTSRGPAGGRSSTTTAPSGATISATGSTRLSCPSCSHAPPGPSSWTGARSGRSRHTERVPRSSRNAPRPDGSANRSHGRDARPSRPGGRSRPTERLSRRSMMYTRAETGAVTPHGTPLSAM
jgi:hypothetical protein